MATNTTRKSSTAKAAPATKAGAASAASKDTNLTVESDAPVTVDAPEAEATVTTRRGPVPANLIAEEPKITEGIEGPAGTVEEPKVERLSEAEPEAEAVPVVEPKGVDVHVGELSAAGRDMAALARLADTSGRPQGTPYKTADGVIAPAPIVVLPPLKDTFNWCADGDRGLTARVLVDGWRPRVNGFSRFASKGDRVTAPEDIINRGVARGSVALENL